MNNRKMNIYLLINNISFIIYKTYYELLSELVGWKAYGLAQFSKLGLFNRPFTILESWQTEERNVEMLKNAGFINQQEVAIRFSKNNEMNLPFYLWKFDLKEIARIISNERADLIPFVHGLVKTVFSASLYFDGKMFL